MSRCNFCIMEDFSRLADQRGHNTTVLPKPVDGFPDGVDVYVHPLTEDHTDWWVAWLAKIPTECHCDE